MLPGALSTVERQTFQDYEVLIVDDGSSDDTREAVKPWTRDPRFKYKRLDKNIGNMACRNLALEMARGTWITNIDSDDFWLLDRLRAFADYFQARPQAGFVFSNGYLHRFGRLIGLAFDPGRPIREGKVPGHYAVGEEFLPYLTTNLAIPRALYEKYGHYRKDMVILDNELYARMLADGVEVGVIRKPLAVRRIHGGQVTHKWIEEYPEAVEALIAGGASPEILASEKRKLALQVAGYLWRDLRPRQARAFLLKELGAQARSRGLYWSTFLPRPFLALAKALREWALRLRHARFWARSEERAVYRLIDPLIAAERRPPQR